MNPDAEGRLGPEWGGVHVAKAASDIRLTRAIWMISLAVVLYDYLLTFDDEMNFMWSGNLKFMWTRSLFAASRYWTILNLIIHNVVLALSNSPDTVRFHLFSCNSFTSDAATSCRCRIWYFYVVFATAGTSLTTTVIAQLRIYAMYSCNRKLLMVMVAAVTLSFGVQGPILLLMVVKAKTFRLQPVYTGCYAVDPMPYVLPYWVSWVPYLAYESFIFALAIYKSFALAQDQPETPWLVYILLRDSVGFFGGTFAIVLVNCLVNAFGRPQMFSAFTALYIALYSILGCRMLLNVRAAANPWARYDTALYGFNSSERSDVSTVRFARRNEPTREDEEAIELQGLSPGSTYTSPNVSTRNLLK